MKTFAIILCLSVLLGHAIADADHNELSLVKGYTLSGTYKFNKYFKCLVTDLGEVQDVISEGHCPRIVLGRRLLLESDSTATGRALLATPDLNATLSSAIAAITAALNSTLDTLNDTDAGRRHLLDYHPIEVSILAKESLLKDVAKVVIDLSKAKHFLYQLKYFYLSGKIFGTIPYYTVNKAAAVAFAPKYGIVSLDYDTDFFVHEGDTASPRLTFDVKDDKLPKFGIVVESVTYLFNFIPFTTYVVYPAFDATEDLKPTIPGLVEEFN